MSTKAKSLAAARKMKDRWRAKEWYRIIAPEMFNMSLLGETPADVPENLMGRTMEATVQDLTGDFSKMHIKLKFKVNDIRGLDAHTVFMGHDLTSDYIRRLTRRRRSKTDTTVDVTTKDGWELRVKPMAISEQRIQASQRTAVRNTMDSTLKKAASENTVGEFVKMIMGGDLGRMMASNSKQIVPLKRVEIRKSEVHRVGSMRDIAEVLKAMEEEEAERERQAAEAEQAAAKAAAQAEAEQASGEEAEEEAVESEELSETELAEEAEEAEDTKE